MRPKPATKEPHVEEPPEKAQRTIFQEYSEAFVVAVILAIIIRAVLFQAFKIPSGSMEPTLQVGDHIIVSKFIYGIRIPYTDWRWPRFTDPQRNDVIVFVFPKNRVQDFIKRVVAVGGDTVEIKNKRVFINGKPAEDPYAHIGLCREGPTHEDYGANMWPVTVPKGFLFVMGDNRNCSHDSRFWGFVPVEDVKGEACLIYYSAYEFPHGLRRIFSIIR
jgi:signal peptidase I